MEEITYAVARILPTEGNDVHGTVTFAKEDTGISIHAEFTGLTPGKHAFHVHERGDCTAHDGASACAHFNPTNAPHAGPDDAERHVGDLGNVEADDNGNAVYDRVDSVITLEGENSVIGRSIIIHTGEDDFVTQPTGDAGGRIGCGVIGISSPEDC